jgi:hypothetical protein
MWIVTIYFIKVVCYLIYINLFYRAVDIAIGYGLEDRGVGDRLPVKYQFLSSLYRPYRL